MSRNVDLKIVGNLSALYRIKFVTNNCFFVQFLIFKALLKFMFISLCNFLKHQLSLKSLIESVPGQSMLASKLPSTVDKTPELGIQLFHNHVDIWNVVIWDIIIWTVVERCVIWGNVLFQLKKWTVDAITNGTFFWANFNEKRQMPFGDCAKEDLLLPVDAFAYQFACLEIKVNENQNNYLIK